MFFVLKCAVSYPRCDIGVRAASCELLQIFSQFWPISWRAYPRGSVWPGHLPNCITDTEAEFCGAVSTGAQEWQVALIPSDTNGDIPQKLNTNLLNSWNRVLQKLMVLTQSRNLSHFCGTCKFVTLSQWNTSSMQHCAGFISAESLYMFRAQAPIIRSI